MDLASILGLVAGAVLVLVAILMGSSIGTFVNVPSVLVVVGGTIAATAIAFPGRELKMVGSVTSRVFKNPKQEMIALMRFLLECRKVSAKEGPLALEEMAEKAPMVPVAKALQLVADGTEPTTLRDILATEQRAIQEHHKTGQKLFTEMGKFAPAFGMIGTLIGLVQMLATLDDPSTIGPKMAVALLTTLYGALLSNLVFLPMVTKLERRLKSESARLDLALVGVMALKRQEPTLIMREKFKAFLPDHPGDLEELLTDGRSG